MLCMNSGRRAVGVLPEVRGKWPRGVRRPWIWQRRKVLRHIMNEAFTVRAQCCAISPRCEGAAGRVVARARRGAACRSAANAAQWPKLAGTFMHSRVVSRFHASHLLYCPTGTISCSRANNASNGIEPSVLRCDIIFATCCAQQETKKRSIVFLIQLPGLRELINSRCDGRPSATPAEKLPDYFIFSADDSGPQGACGYSAAAQLWIVPDLQDGYCAHRLQVRGRQDMYMYAFEQGLKGCTRSIQSGSVQGVLVKEDDPQ